MSDNHDGNIAVLTRKNCRQMFFVYAGGLGMVEGMGPMDFLRKSGLSDRNVVFVRDPHTRYFQFGVSEELKNLDDVVEWHRAHIEAQTHVDEIYCVGNSFGGWAALLFGHLFAAKKVWALAPAGIWGRDLLVDLMAEHNGTTEYDLYYSPEIEKDRLFAEALEDIPGVNTTQNTDHGHLIIRGMLRTGELPQLFPPFRASEEAA